VTPFNSILDVAWPADSAAWIAFFLGALVLATPWFLRAFPRLSLPCWVGVWAFVSALLSVAYIHTYLRGGPRIIDATGYWLEARGFASGMVTWIADEPTAAIRGRFLVHHPSAEGLRVGVLFPPGYPALLALGFLLHVPWLVGPILASAFTVSSCLLAHRLTRRDDIVRIVAVLSALNACLRYHTADTMSHGLAAVLLTTSVVVALHASNHRWGYWLVCGALTAWLAATRPATALALVVVGGPLVARFMLMHRRLAPLWSLLGMLPVFFLTVLHQHALTGAWFTSSQGLYYSLADGPEGCFRYGFGSGIGCLAEHGPYVASVAPDGFGLRAAFTTTGRRLYLHLADLLNYAPFAIFLPLGVIQGWREKNTWLAVAMPLALIAAYAPFYFDGSYPGGGARLLVDAMAFEHLLMALGLGAWGRAFRNPARGAHWAVAMATSLSLLGFALHGSRMHQCLREREGGRPMYEPSVVRDALGAEPRGLLFVDSDHGFFLGFDPSATDPKRSLVVARARYDSRDYLRWNRLGRPPTYRYVYRYGQEESVVRIEPFMPTEPHGSYVFEAEAEWPALAQKGGYAVPTPLMAQPCIPSGRVLSLVRTGEEARVMTEIPVPSPGTYWIQGFFVANEPVPSLRSRLWSEDMDVAMGVGAAGTATGDGRYCVATKRVPVHVFKKHIMWDVLTTDSWVALDRVELQVLEAK